MYELQNGFRNEVDLTELIVNVGTVLVEAGVGGGDEAHWGYAGCAGCALAGTWVVVVLCVVVLVEAVLPAVVQPDRLVDYAVTWLDAQN